MEMIWTLFFWSLAAAFLPNVVFGGSITVAAVSLHPTNMAERLSPFANYLAFALKSEGFDSGQVIIAKSASEMMQLLSQDKVDLFFDDALSSAALSGLSKSELLLRRWRRGIAEYHAVFFAKKNSGINRLEDVVGKKIAFEHPISGIGYLAPKFFLLQKGFRMSLKKDFHAPVGPKEIGYVFSNDDENTMAWILRGKIEAGAMSNERYHSEARGSISDLAVVDRTFSVPRQVISHRKNLRAALVARIKKILMEMDRSEQGRKVLEEFERTSKFDEIPAQSKSRLIALGEWVATELALK